MLQTLDPANRELRLIPLLKDKCDLPLEIGYLTYVNFADPDDPTWPWTQLLTALGAAPIQEPPPAPERPGWFLPHPYGAQPNFTGRVAERQMLSDWLADGLAHVLSLSKGRPIRCWSCAPWAASARARWPGTGCITTWTRPAGPAPSGGASTRGTTSSTASCGRRWRTCWGR